MDNETIILPKKSLQWAAINLLLTGSWMTLLVVYIITRQGAYCWVAVALFVITRIIGMRINREDANKSDRDPHQGSR